MSYSVYTYPWNFTADNYRRRLDDIQALGLQGINLAASYHAGKFIHPGGVRGRVYFPEDGVLYFKPRADYGRIRPVASSLLEDIDIFALLGGVDGLPLNAWTVLLHNTRLGLQYPQATVRNAFGDAYVYSLCPAHPEVRAYAVALCQDLAAHYPVNSLLLETPGYMAYHHGYHHEFAQVSPNTWLEAQLALCFCEHCLVGADRVGIDGARLRGMIAAAIDDYLDGSQVNGRSSALTWLENDVPEQAELEAFLAWRCEVVTSLIREIRARVRPEVNVKVITTTQPSHATSVLEGHDLPALQAAADGLEAPLYQSSPVACKAEAEQVLKQVGTAASLSVILRPGWPDMHSEQQLVETLAGAEALGLRDINFYNYDMLRPRYLQWLENALKGASN